MARKKLGQILIEMGYVTQGEVDEALKAQGQDAEKKLGELELSFGLSFLSLGVLALLPWAKSGE